MGWMFCSPFVFPSPLPGLRPVWGKKQPSSRLGISRPVFRGALRGGGRMSEERPVPRRESPWGLPEGDKRQPKAHRCNDRVEDVVQACFEGNPFKTVPGPFKLFWQCMRSNPGEEPTEPFTYLQLDPPKRVEAKLE
ncbi:uncharacterized protein LOC100844151 isoform X2 [Brachypodium distachyon]|uniref:Uncharacterized protein n=1 Tax=Brachypodium distachyon TaxID=15368 RepID=A0A0Q3H2Q8_BRADI|nr:uncharacterized protein LOC100844151 isoform X2 [Brachypodium distachyon]KQK17168.1 hypothetical protein BRADI_1g32821v3 [Brachypodium distachyon]|eukprot:XP_003563424.2 uncharacterized protein LOC100844151 isoform X2 [Brachypodium distachyon]